MTGPDHSPAVIPVVGDLVKVRYTKWGGARHWTFLSEYLGEDKFGRWVGCTPGTVLDKPSATIEPRMHFVVLFPLAGGYTPCINEAAARLDPPNRAFEGVAVYVDVTTVPRWAGARGDSSVTMVDLDLDIIRQWDGLVFVDDQDEFAEHQVALAYPHDVIARAEADCAEILAAVQNNDEPYATVGQAWLDRFIASKSIA